MQRAKEGLGERGPVWWDDGAPDYTRHLAHNSPYRNWYAEQAAGTCIGRGDLTPLAGFEQDDYVRAARFSERPLGELLEAYAAQRRATLATLRSFDAEAWLHRGTVSGHPCSTRALAYIAAGHELYHIADFHERYGI